MKLTKPQVAFLRKIAVTPVVPKGHEWIIARKLRSLGLAKRTLCGCRYEITGLGQDYIVSNVLGK